MVFCGSGADDKVDLESCRAKGRIVSDPETNEQEIEPRGLTLLVLLPCAGAILGLIISALSSSVAPKKDESVPVIQIHPLRMVSSTGEPHDSLVGLYETDWFLEPEIEVMRSRETLMRIVERLDLTRRWRMDSGMAGSIGG